MKLGFAKRFSQVIVGAICCVGVMALTCGKPTAPGTTDLMKELTVTNQISGWMLDTSVKNNPQPFTNSTATNLVDGGVVDYQSPSLDTGIGTYFKSTQGNRQMLAFVLDYTTDSSAKSEFNLWVNKRGDTMGLQSLTITSFLDTSAIGFETGGGLYAYAHFKNYYVEMTFSNYDSSSQAVPDASAFFNYYYSKIK